MSAIANEAVLHVDSIKPTLLARAFKRTFDIVVAGAMLLVAAPILAVVAILVKKEDGGPVFFRQQRVGLGDAEFGMLKFRTMCVDAEAKLGRDAKPTTSAPARCSSWPGILASPRSATSCAAPAWTSCRSSSTS